MKVHYINILLCALPLNILAHNNNKPSITHKYTNRSLCECDIYMPNYDNDPEMKRVMQQFQDRTSQRFNEYDDRMKEKRKQCKEHCDKESQKIILKDKLEKQMAQQFATLDTDITTDDIPACVCEKSMADKVEKGCLRCAGVFGGGVMPGMGLIDGSLLGAISVLQHEALKGAIEAAKDAAIAVGKVAGDAYRKKKLIEALTHYGVKDVCPKAFESIRNMKHYTEVTKFYGAIIEEYNRIGVKSSINASKLNNFKVSFGLWDPENGVPIGNPSTDIPSTINSVVRTTKTAADAEAAKVTLSETPVLQARYTAAVESTYTSFQTTIIASIIAIVVIVLIMVIIYKILRYRRKKKMKKKLQYIKLLEE
ncbi:rifin PIR protein, putative [Plasmodium reichenowi]|uniref:Rifin PIR protein, putative n=1 Tax=Plasmodium reichenowi TaxID=5854 RepID=A0A2P9DKV1_PLARE|nr:rifin PIR protein, putative [Plasmodium reichenowi]